MKKKTRKARRQADPNRGSRRALAVALGVAPSWIMKACKLGRISKAVGADNKLNFELAIQELEASADPGYEHVRERFAEYRARRDGTERANPDAGAAASPPAEAPPVLTDAARAGGDESSGAAGHNASAEVDDGAGDHGAATPGNAGAGDLAPPANVANFQDAKTRKEQYAALTAELDYRAKAGDLVGVGPVRKAAFNAGRILREALMRIPDRVAQVLAVETDPIRVHTVLTGELEQVLHEFTTGVEQQFAAAGNPGR